MLESPGFQDELRVLDALRAILLSYAAEVRFINLSIIHAS